MKRVLLGLVAALALGCSATPNYKTTYTPPSSTAVRASVDTIKEHSIKTGTAITKAAAKAATLQDRIKVLEDAVKDSPPILQLAQEIHGGIDDLTQLLLDAQKSNSDLQIEVNNTYGKIDELQAKVNNQTHLLNEANDRANAAITQSKIDKANAHKFKAILIGLAVAAVLAILFGTFGLKMFAPPLLYLTIAAPVAVGGFLLFWLGSG